MISRDIDDELPAIRTRVGDAMPSETSFRNLYNVGNATCSFGLIGATGAAESGRRVAQTIREYFKPRKYEHYLTPQLYHQQSEE